MIGEGELVLTTPEAAFETVRQMLEGPVVPTCPASVLRFHQNCTVILDEAAASKLSE